jgi:hypothetical protein
MFESFDPQIAAARRNYPKRSAVAARALWRFCNFENPVFTGTYRRTFHGKQGDEENQKVITMVQLESLTRNYPKLAAMYPLLKVHKTPSLFC